MSIQTSTTTPFVPILLPVVEGLPVEMSRSDMILEMAALAVAALAGDDWSELSEARKRELREAATLAAVISRPEGLRLVGYAMGKTLEPLFMSRSAPIRSFRLGKVDALMGALRGAAQRVSGIYSRTEHRELLDLMQHDASDASRKSR